MRLLSLVCLLVIIIGVYSTDFSPRNIHIAHLGDLSQWMTISWTTTSYDETYSPTVYYGYLPSNLFRKSRPERCRTETYTEEEYHHHCYITELRTPSAKFYYAVGSSDTPKSAIYSFTTAPKMGSLHKSIIFGDLGIENGEATIESIKHWVDTDKISSIMHVGDISYADNVNFGKENPDFERVYNEFFEGIQSITANSPYMVAVGNHDISISLAAPDSILPPWGTNCTAYNTRWHMPSSTSFGSKSMWYSYTHGNVKFIVVSTETDFPNAPFQPDEGETRAGPFGDQHSWLVKELEKSNRREARLFTPWVVVIGHRPLYSSANLDYPADGEQRVRSYFGPLMDKYNVDMYISGHVHLYERTLPIKEEKVVGNDYNFPKGTVYVVSGAAGNMEGHADNVHEIPPPYITYRNGEQYGYSVLETFNGPVEPTLRDNSIGDYVGENRGPNTLKTKEEQDAYFTLQNERQMQAKLRSKQSSSSSSLASGDNKAPCPVSKQITLCQSFYPAMVDATFTDRICIVKCRV